MIHLLFSGDFNTFTLIIIIFIISLTFHEFGHAMAATWLGDNTARAEGRLTLNPLSHLDPIGMLMVATIGFGYARPVPFNPSNLRLIWGDAVVAMAGPLMNLFLAVICINTYVLGQTYGVDFLNGVGQQKFLYYMAIINLILMLFNLIPLGPLDGHYILPRFLSREAAIKYINFNDRYGQFMLLGLIVLSFVGIPIFKFIMLLGNFMLPLITFVA